MELMLGVTPAQELKAENEYNEEFTQSQYIEASYNLKVEEVDLNDELKTEVEHPIRINSVSYLQRHQFCCLSYEDKIKIKELGKPTPELKLEFTGHSRSKTYKRQFNNNVYAKTRWLCGCEERNAFFCFPCLLFEGDKSWTLTGITNLCHLAQIIKRHEGTKQHLSSEVSLALLGNLNIDSQLDSTYRINMQRHNERVSKNRYVLSRIIDCIKFCGAFELALRGRDENVFCGLVNFSAELDNSLRQHLDTASIFKGASKDIQNELLQCMLEVCRETITKEINNANYLAVVVDDTSDVASEYQMAIVLRYVNEGCSIERFWGFINPKKHDAASIAGWILSIIDPLLRDNPNKLVAQAYDGAAMMSVQKIIQQKYPLANFIHSYAHQLDLILPQAASQNPHVRVFFANLNYVVKSFSTFQSLEVFNRVSCPIQAKWNFKSLAVVVKVIYEHRDSLIEFMQEIQEQFQATAVINQASDIERMLEDGEFLFWLNVFYHILPHVDVLSDQLRKRKTNAVHVKTAFATLEAHINNSIKQNVDEIMQKEENFIEDSPKRIRISKENLRTSALEVCDVIIQTAKDRFEYVGHLVAASLFSSKLFNKFSKTFPDEILNTVATICPDMELERFKTELSIIYSRPDFKNLKGAASFLHLLRANNLEEVFKETIKLLEIIITIPMPTGESERRFPTLTRVKNFLRNAVDEKGLSALAMLTLENSFVKKDYNFNEKVIEKFANAKPAHMKLTYKK